MATTFLSPPSPVPTLPGPCEAQAAPAPSPHFVPWPSTLLQAAWAQGRTCLHLSWPRGPRFLIATASGSERSSGNASTRGSKAPGPAGLPRAALGKEQLEGGVT